MDVSGSISYFFHMPVDHKATPVSGSSRTFVSKVGLGVQISSEELLGSPSHPKASEINTVINRPQPNATNTDSFPKPSNVRCHPVCHRLD